MPVSPDLAWTLSDQIGHAYAHLLAQTQSHLDGEQVRVPEFIALVVLTSFPMGITQTAWGTYQGVSRQRAHIIGKHLLEQNLIVVERIGRSSRVRLSPEGEAYVARLQPSLAEQIAALLDPLSQQEAETLSALLTKVLPLP